MGSVHGSICHAIFKKFLGEHALTPKRSSHLRQSLVCDKKKKNQENRTELGNAAYIRPAYLCQFLLDISNFGPQSRFPDFMPWCTELEGAGIFSARSADSDFLFLKEITNRDI